MKNWRKIILSLSCITIFISCIDNDENRETKEMFFAGVSQDSSNITLFKDKRSIVYIEKEDNTDKTIVFTFKDDPEKAEELAKNLLDASFSYDNVMVDMCKQVSSGRNLYNCNGRGVIPVETPQGNFYVSFSNIGYAIQAISLIKEADYVIIYKD